MYIVVSPHPDDAELALGASIKRWTSEGKEVLIAVMAGEGDLRMLHSNEVIPWSRRVYEQELAAKELGCGVEFLGVAPAGKFDTLGLSSFVGPLDKLFPKAEALYIPLPSFNQDHEVTFRACLAATRPSKVDRASIFAYEQFYNSHGVQVHGPLVSRCYIRCDGEGISAKKAALRCHTSQVSGRFDEMWNATKALMVTRGAEVGMDFAEMVYPIRQVL